MESSMHYEKRTFEILTDDGYQEIDNYLIFRDGYYIKDQKITLNIENKEKFDILCNKYKKHMFRIKYNKFSKFFVEDDLTRLNSNLLDYQVYEVLKTEKYVKDRVPLNTFITMNDGTKFNLNNYILKINYDVIVDSAFRLPIDSSIEYDKKAEGNTINYLSNTNILYFNGKDKYLNLRNIINDGSLVLYKEYKTTEDSNPVKNALVYNEKLIGTIENENKISTNLSLIPCVYLHGSEIDISIGLSASIAEMEDIIYYKDIEKLVGQTTYNEYRVGDLLYAQDTNALYLLSENGFDIIDINNVSYDYNEPESPKLGALWFNMTYSNLNVWDGYMWKQLSRPSLETICKKSNLDRKYGNLSDAYLEVYGYNEDDEFQVLEMYLNSEIVKDVEFDIGDNFVDTVFINGDEFTAFNDANYGVNLIDPVYRGDLFQVIMVKEKLYHWVNGNVIDMSTIKINHPYEINSIRKLMINEEEYFVKNIVHNTIKVSDLTSNNMNYYPALNTCDRVKAKIKLGEKLSKVYPTVIVKYEENLNKIPLPFNISKNRFAKFMIMNNGEEVILNPELILEPDKLYAYYNLSEPDVISFNRNVSLDDNIIIQFIKHIPCEFNPESMFDNINSNKDIADKLIKDAMKEFGDDSTSLDYVLSKVDNSKIEKEISDKIYENAYISGLVYDTKNEEEKLKQLIDDATKKSNPDISAVAIANQPVSSKYNLKFTEDYMNLRSQLKSYLYNLNSKFSNILSELFLARDALRSLVNYLCNTLCLKEILQGIIAAFGMISKGLSKVNDLINSFSWEKLKNMLKNMWDAINNAMDKFLEAFTNIFGMGKDFLKKLWNKSIETIKAIGKGVMNVFKGVGKAAKALWNKIKGLFSKFKDTKIGEETGSFNIDGIFGKIWGALKKVGQKIWAGIKAIGKGFTSLWNDMKKLWQKIKEFEFKDFFSNLTIEQIIDYICNKILKNLLNAIDKILGLLYWLQQKFQQILNRAFADNYRSPINQLNQLQTCANFFKSHIDICQILKEIFASPENLRLTVFIKRVTNLETIFQQWKYNKSILKNIGRNTISPYGGSDIGSIANSITNAILLNDELHGINYQMIEMVIANLKRAFIPTFKATTGSILDKEAMSRRLFNKEYFTYLTSKIVPF